MLTHIRKSICYLSYFPSKIEEIERVILRSNRFEGNQRPFYSIL